MNQFSFPLAPIFKTCLVQCILFLLPYFLNAQFARHLPVVDLTTDVKGWTEKSGSIAAQVSTFRWLGLRAGVSYSPQQNENTDFLSQSKSLEILGEARLFPFGPPKKAFKKDRRPAYWKKPKAGCSGKTCLGEIPSFGAKKFFSGIFIAPGYSYQELDEVVVPKALQRVAPSKITFTNHTINQGPTLTTGYQIRLRNFTIGAGYALKASKARADSPNLRAENAGNAVFPYNVNIHSRWSLEAGINF